MYRRIVGESTADWLERMLSLPDVPESRILAIMALLETEKVNRPKNNGRYSIFILF